MSPSVSFAMVETANGQHQPKEITGSFESGMAVLRFTGPAMEIILKGFTLEQLRRLQAEAAYLAVKLGQAEAG